MGSREAVCGYTLGIEDVYNDIHSYFPDKESWHKHTSAVCCYRNPWENSKNGHCIWHADIPGKSPEKLLKAKKRETTPVCIDGAILRDIKFTDNISFIEWSIIGGVFENISLEGASFTSSDLRYVCFTDSNLSKTRFIESNLSRSRFRVDIDLWKAQFETTRLWKSTFRSANIQEGKFCSTDLQGAMFSDVSLDQAKFSSVKLQDANFLDTSLVGAYFSSIEGKRARFSDTNLLRAEFEDSNLRNTCFTDPNTDKPHHANLEDAVIKNTDLRGVSFGRTRLYQTVLTDIRINSLTTFNSDRTIYEERPDMDAWFTPNTTPLEAAAWVNRRLEDLHEENAMADQARNFHIRKQETELQFHSRQARSRIQEGIREAFEAHKRGFQKVHSSFIYAPLHSCYNIFSEIQQGWRSLLNGLSNSIYHKSRSLEIRTMGMLSYHGESLRRIIAWAVGVIVISGVLYPFTGGFTSSTTGVTYRFSIQRLSKIDDLSKQIGFLMDHIPVFLKSLYLSATVFTTLGSGLQPVSMGSKILFALESLFGSVLIALFIFVLGRRVAR